MSRRLALFAAAILFAAVIVALRPVRAAAAPGDASTAPAAGASTATPDTSEDESYYGVFLQGMKVGSYVVHRTDVPASSTRPAAVRCESAMNLDLQILGSAAAISTTEVSYSDAKTARPLAEEDRTEGGGRVTTVSATYTDRSVHYDTDVQGNKQSGTLTLNPGESFLFDTSTMPDFHPKVGMELKGKIFVAETQQLADEDMKVVSQEPVTVGGSTVSGYRVVENGVAGVTTSYVNGSGDLLLSSGPLGMELRKMPKALALAPPDAGAAGLDLADVVAITPTGAPIGDPATVRSAHYVISDVTKHLPESDSVQSAAYSVPSDDGMSTADVDVTARPLPATGGRLYPSADAAPPALRPYLAATAYVPCDSPTFRDLARQIVGTETTAAPAAAKIAAWVHAKVKPDPGIAAALRSASDVLTEPRGVCRDYTVLFTAIARAAGIPTKQCVGVVCANGRFYYHAWPEVWVGDPVGETAGSSAPGWVALEPTLDGEPYADATHIKLAEGELTDVTRIAADMGKYRIEVKAAEH